MSTSTLLVPLVSGFLGGLLSLYCVRAWERRRHTRVDVGSIGGCRLGSDTSGQLTVYDDEGFTKRSRVRGGRA